MLIANNSDQRNVYILFLMFFGGLGGILYGYDIGVIAGALLFMHKEIALTTLQTSLIVGSVLGGGALATLVSGAIADFLGRRKTIILSAVIFIIGVIILVSAHTFISVLFGRLIQGAGIGIEIILIPLYLAESIPAHLRGKSVTLFQLFLTTGIVLAYAINIFFASSENWRGMFYCVLIPGVLFLICSLFLTESPRWLYLKQKKDASLKALLKTHSLIDAQNNLQQMALLLQKDEQTQTKISIWQRRYIVPFLIALAIASLNQLTGINSLLQYGTLILKQSGMSSNMGAMLGSVGVGAMNVIVTVIAFLLIDKVGRKPLLVLGTGGTVCSLLFLGLVPLLSHNSLFTGYMTLLGFILFIVFFAIGPGVVVWLAISELMPTRIRSKGMAICLFANSAVSAILASSFLIIIKHIHLSGAFFMCAFFTVFYLLVAIYALPETKNKSLEEIEQNFHNNI